MCKIVYLTSKRWDRPSYKFKKALAEELEKRNIEVVVDSSYDIFNLFRRHKTYGIAIGFDFYQDKIKNYSSTSYGYTDEWKDRTITNRAFYFQDAWYIDENWTLTSGIRTDDHSVYGRHNTPSVVLAYDPDEKTNYYMSYKEFFVSPNQYQLYSGKCGYWLYFPMSNHLLYQNDLYRTVLEQMHLHRYS